MRYIDNSDLRQWVQESLQRKLVQQAHELAVQTGCEVLLRVQDDSESLRSKYYATEGILYEYVNYGVKVAPGDQLMSGESGLPLGINTEIRRHNATETGVSPSYNLDGNRANLPVSSDMAIGAPRSPDEAPPPYVHRGSLTEELIRLRAPAASLQMEFSRHAGLERRLRMHESFHPQVRPANASFEAGISHHDHLHNVHGSSADNQSTVHPKDDSLMVMQRMHFTNLGLRRINSPEPETPRRPQDIIAIAQQSEISETVTSDHLRRTNAVERNRTLPAHFPYSNVGTHDTGDEKETRRETTFVNNVSQPYLCRLCHHTFSDLYNLVMHAKVHHFNLDQLVFVCQCCQTSFEDAKSLHHHLDAVGAGGFAAGAACELRGVTKHPAKSRRFSCPVCGKRFSRFGFMQSHIERIHGGHQLSASVSMSARPGSFADNQEAALPTNDNQSTDAEVVVDKVSRELKGQSLEIAVVQETGVTVKDDGEMRLANQSISSSAPLLSTDANVEVGDQPVRSQSEVGPDSGKDFFECQECNKQFAKGRFFKKHVNNCHIAAITSHHNHQSTRNSVIETSIPVHAMSPNEKNNITTNGGIANQTLNSPMLEVKQESMGNILDLRILSDPVKAPSLQQEDSGTVYSGNTEDDTGACNDQVSPRENKAQPQAETAGLETGSFRSKRYACDVCGKTYKYSFHMKEHRLTHAAVCPFTCRLCGMGFFRQRQMRDHELRHTGMYPCRCELCGKGFPRTSELKRHRAFRHRRLDATEQQPLKC